MADNPRRTGDELREAQRTARHIVAEGVTWLVYELGLPYDRRRTSLVFESDGLVRRVRNYPAEWRELTDTELLRLKDAV